MKKIKGTVIILMLALCMSLTACGSSSDISYNSGITGTSYNERNDMDLTMSVDSVSTSGGKSISSFKSTTTAGMGESYNYNSVEYEDVYDTTEEYVEIPKSEAKPIENNEYYESKLIYHANVDIETLEFDKAYAELKELIKKHNAFIENEQFSNSNGSLLYNNRYDDPVIIKRQSQILIRVPSSNYEAFCNENEALGNVINKTSSVDNITQTYYDTEAQKIALEARLARLLDMLENAVEYEDLIVINQELSNVEYELSKIKTVIRTMDMDVAYSYVRVKLIEVAEYTDVEEEKEDTFINRLIETVKLSASDFLDLLERLLFAIVMFIPYLVILAVIIIVCKVIFRNKFKEFKETKKAEKELLTSIVKDITSKNKSNKKSSKEVLNTEPTNENPTNE